MQCPICQADNSPEAKFCNQCGSRLPTSEFSPAPHPERPQTKVIYDPERKVVTALFSALTGYTALSERLDPEQVKEITGEVFAGVKRIIAKYEGFIDRLLGDGVLAFFGIPKAHEDDPLRAIRAASEIHQRHSPGEAGHLHRPEPEFPSSHRPVEHRPGKALNERENEILMCYYRAGNSLAYIDNLRMFLVVMASVRRAIRTGISTLHTGWNIWFALSGNFSAYGLSFKLSNRMLEVSQHLEKAKDIGGRIQFACISTINHHYQGTWGQIQEMDRDLLDSSFRIGDFFHSDKFLQSEFLEFIIRYPWPPILQKPWECY
jgi:hypothetical protein